MPPKRKQTRSAAKAKAKPKPKTKSAFEVFASSIARDKTPAAGDQPNEVDMLLRQPNRDNDKPHNYVPEPGMVQQADLIYLPWDNWNGKLYKYALVVVDVANGMTDAVPLEDRDAELVLAGFKTIYGRPVRSKKDSNVPKRRLKYPKVIMQVDGGTEFKGVTAKYFEDNGTIVKVGLPGRSRSQSWAENRNYQIGKMVAKYQTAIELNTNKVSRQWVNILNLMVDSINSTKGVLYRPKEKGFNAPVCRGTSCKLIDVGTKVRRKLDKPVDITTGKRLVGGFRATDVRWEREPRTVTNVVLKPENPPIYILSGLSKVGYTKAQLQVVDANEKKVGKSDGADEVVVADLPSGVGVPEKIVKKVPKVKGLKGVQFLVKWKGERKPQYASYQEMKGSNPEMVKAFEKAQRAAKKK